MRYLVIGGGGREHAIVVSLAQEEGAEIYCAPGNAGTESLATNVELKAEQVGGVLDFAHQKAIDLVIIGPEAPLVAGLADQLRTSGIKVFGPSRQAAQLEGSKIFAKQFMRRHNIPTADFVHFNNLIDVDRYLNSAEGRMVVKADGLAAGKGVVICEGPQEAGEVAKQFMAQNRFGEAGHKILIENCLEGVEVSVFCITDGRTLLMLPTAQDYKRAFDDDQGPNTGGMGAISPSPALDDEAFALIERKILIPTIHGMRIEDLPFTGVLYVGLMLTKAGPRVLEYNVRFGDPEAQALLPRLREPLGPLLMAAVEERLQEMEPDWDERCAVTVVGASEGYPEAPKSGREILKLPASHPDGSLRVYHAGTKRTAGRLLTNGGRVIAITGLGADPAAAREKAYEGMGRVKIPGLQFRRDIGA